MVAVVFIVAVVVAEENGNQRSNATPGGFVSHYPGGGACCDVFSTVREFQGY